MRKANAIRGRIEEHGRGVGTSDEEAVRRRAKEIAITNGRTGDQFNEADLQQARLELEDAQNAPIDDSEDSIAEFVPRGTPVEASPGRAARTKVATDEQTFPEMLVSEGMEEAAHERMVQGNQESLRRDQEFEDQLPESGE